MQSDSAADSRQPDKTTPQGAPTSGPGRPVDTTKEAAILEAARLAFIAQPYDRVSVDAIAAAANVSKVTIYARFGSKDQLFVRAMSASTDVMYEQARIEAEAGLPLPELLHQLGVNFVCKLTAPDMVALWGAMKQAAAVAPDLPAQFYGNVIARSLGTLANVLALADQRGEIRCENPREVAVQFVSMVQGEFRLRGELGVGPPPEDEAIDAYVASCVRLLMAGLRVPDRP
jgi:TetR/AcrR family transcriptional regulator, mexJK operon transcriptional repressor